MTNTDERVHYGFDYSDAVRVRALSLHLIELDGKLIKVLLIFTAESAKRGGEESAINARRKSVRESRQQTEQTAALFHFGGQ